MICRNKHFNIGIRAFINDAPAWAFILGVKHHSGYYCCNKCVQKGERFERRIIFKKEHNVSTCNESFRNRLYPDHHNITEEPALEKLQIDMVEQFPFDYMHVVCLGVVKTILVAWTRVRRQPFSLRRDSISLISAQFCSLKIFFPKEISRKPRPLDDLERFKATELRTFLLYTGPVVMKGFLDTARYNHFLVLSLGIRLLLHEEYCKTKNGLADALLNKFVEEIPTLYSFTMLSFNFHCLTHLSRQALKFNSLETISAFPFENFLGQLKVMVKKSDFVIEQLYNRIVEKSLLNVFHKVDKFNNNVPGQKIYLYIYLLSFSLIQPVVIHFTMLRNVCTRHTN
ncbi:uncharacterized protein LOC118751636 [Rhagoletis pomonella]|uniref:uncharacterized protein LOC118751636 n=1 Tax=Rhagoletis pomonella TaxID=28610 RepID=UPI00177D5262|nr:uncharacterized protein LOC118751636 [Rhagoletis pomonella]